MVNRIKKTSFFYDLT